MVVEVEFNSLEDANNFEVPNWFGKEITEDLRYKNDNLAIATKEEVAELLKDTGVIHLNNHFSHTNLSVKWAFANLLIKYKYLFDDGNQKIILIEWELSYLNKNFINVSKMIKFNKKYKYIY